MMTHRHFSLNGPNSTRRGLTLVEVVVSTMLIGMVLVGATDLLGSVIRGHADSSDRAVGAQLAHQLMTEILGTQYEDPNSPVFGPEADESSSDRSDFDDVDDYSGWAEAEASDAAAVQIMTISGWSRKVAVDFVDPSDVSTTTATDEGLKRITIGVSRKGKVVAQLVALCSNTSD